MEGTMGAEGSTGATRLAAAATAHSAAADDAMARPRSFLLFRGLPERLPATCLLTTETFHRGCIVRT